VVDLDAALGQQLFDVAVRQAKRRYQRTASTITSGGKRKPANADRVARAGRERRILIPTVSLLNAVTTNATAPPVA
jgi:dihydropteroate synthase